MRVPNNMRAAITAATVRVAANRDRPAVLYFLTATVFHRHYHPVHQGSVDPTITTVAKEPHSQST